MRELTIGACFVSVAVASLVVACGSDAGPAGAPRDAGPDVVAGDAGPLPPPIARSRTALTAFRFFASNELSGAEAPAFDDSAWEIVTVPHTFDKKKLPFVAYSHAWYRAHFNVDARSEQTQGRVYVDFEGAGTVADVFVNGRSLGQHRGLYTRFVFDATPATVPGDNVLAVRIDNTDVGTADCLPSTPIARHYYEPYGGIFRKAWLVGVDPVHVDATDLGSSGVYLTPRIPEAGGDGSLEARTIVRNTSGAARAVHVAHHVRDASGKLVATLATDVVVTDVATSVVTGVVPAPHAWSPSDPHLHTVLTEISVDGVVRDTVTERIGFRAFRMTPNGFFVNGKSTPLRGVAKHQESEQHFAAMTDDELRADWTSMRDIGFNYARIVHYPHAKLEYDLADELGVVVWAENGYSGGPYAWSKTGETITREMVRQNYNHPSIAFWSAGNEAADFIHPETVDAVLRYGKAIREEDATRSLTYASNSSFSDPSFDFIAHNLYEGLSGFDPWLFEPDAASTHYVSESGGRSMVTQHDDYANPQHTPNVFEPEEYIQHIAEACSQVVFRTKVAEVPLFTWFAYRDFQLDGRIGGISNNGIVTYDGAHAKDHAYLFQSFLHPEKSVIHILGALHYVRRGAANNGVKAYSNANNLTLTINGVAFGTLANGAYTHANARVVENVFHWPVTLYQGPNYVHLDDGAGHSDDAVVIFAGSGGQTSPALPTKPIVSTLSSSNAQNPAFFVDRAISADMPVYYDLDGTADNSFAAIPASIEGARQVATKRLTKPANMTDLVIGIDAGTPFADVLIVTSDDGTTIGPWSAAGFTDGGVAGTWRDNGLNLVPFRLLTARVSAGARVTIAGQARDYVVLVRAAK